MTKATIDDLGLKLMNFYMALIKMLMRSAMRDEIIEN